MEFLAILVIIFALTGLVSYLLTGTNPSKSLQSSVTEKLVIEKKKCPPHQWFWQEIVDSDGTKHGERIVCKVCGPLNYSPGREDS